VTSQFSSVQRGADAPGKGCRARNSVHRQACRKSYHAGDRAVG
jgi:hypothetical protein